MHIFPPIGKKYANFSPIDLIFTTKKSLKFFACGTHHYIIINFFWGKNMNQERGGGQNMNSKFNIHP